LTGATIGSTKTIVINATQSIENTPIGILNLPKVNKLGLKFDPLYTRNAIGIPYEIYNPIVLMDRSALNATGLRIAGRVRIQANNTTKMTIRYGIPREDNLRKKI